jgi:hypothetical protein
MSNEHPIVVAALGRKRADIAYEIGELERDVEAKRQELIHIDAVIRMFAPDLNPADGPVRVRRPRRLDYFSHGEISRRCFDALRGGATLPASDIARSAMTDKGLNYDADRHMRIEFTRRITMQLNSLARKGDVVKVGNGRGVRWRLPSAG